MDIKQIVLQFSESGGLGLWVWWFYNQLRKRWPAMKTWPVQVTRPIIYLLCAVWFVPVFLFSIWMGWLIMPTTPQDFVMQVALYAAFAFVVANQGHAAEKDSDRINAA